MMRKKNFWQSDWFLTGPHLLLFHNDHDWKPKKYLAHKAIVESYDYENEKRGCDETWQISIMCLIQAVIVSVIRGVFDADPINMCNWQNLW